MLRDVVNASQQQDADGIAVVFDSSRSKFLSATRPVFTFARHHRRARVRTYLRTIDRLPSNASGYLLSRDATITALTVELNSAATISFDIEVERAGVFIQVASISLSAEAQKTTTALDIDLQAGDRLAAKVTTGEADFPVLGVELAWRVSP